MTEKEKMLAGMLYYSGGDELSKERIVVKKLCQKLNNTPVDNMEERNKLVDSILGSHGINTYIEPPFFCDYGYNTHVGDNFYSNHNLVILDCNKVSIGNNVFIAPNCGIYTAGHPIDSATRNANIEYAYEIEIGNDVWIGGNVSILPGVKIGNNCVIGAGSVVNRSIPDNSIAVGNPCKVINKIEE